MGGMLGAQGGASASPGAAGAAGAGGYTPPRGYLSDQAPAPLGANVAGAIRSGLTNSLPQIERSVLDQPGLAKLSGGAQQNALAQFFNQNYDPFSALIAQTMGQRGNSFPAQIMQQQFDSQRPDLIKQMMAFGNNALQHTGPIAPAPKAPPGRS